MNVEALRVQNYRCIDDSGWVSVEALTCVVGKNESGKTAFMEAVEKLNPAYAVEGYEPYRDYPRADWPRYRDRHETDPAIVASARCSLTVDDHEAVEAEFGRQLLAPDRVTVHKDYQNELRWNLTLDESACIAYLRETYEFEPHVTDALANKESFAALDEATLDPVEAVLGAPPEDALETEIGAVLADRLPEFRYVGEYAVMNGTIDVQSLCDRRDADELEPGDRVFLSLLSVAGLDIDALATTENWREMMTELETASSQVSDGAMRYWSQSGDILIRIQELPDGDGRTLEVRVENREQNVGVAFDNRSRGFRSFFSAFCQLAALQTRDDQLFLLLDEPGLNLHARAKQEFLAFLRSEIAGQHTVLYTTHSPFMIDPTSVHRVKLAVADPTHGTNIVSDVSAVDPTTRFPLRNVFELDLMDTLLVKPQTLLVEDKTDHIYLYVLSKLLSDDGTPGLDDRWTVVPIRDARNIENFIALFGENRLDVAALLREPPADSAQLTRDDGQRQTADQPTSADDRPFVSTTDGELSRDRGLSFPAGTENTDSRGRDTARNRRAQRQGDRPNRDDSTAVTVKLFSTYVETRGTATIEDMLSESFYLALVSRAYAGELSEREDLPDRLTSADISDTDEPIVERVREYFETEQLGGFERDRPALFLQTNRDELADVLDKPTVRAFTRLFTNLNNTLESFDGVESTRGGFFGGLFR